MRMNRLRNSNSVRKRICRKILAVLLIIGIPAVMFLFTFTIKKVEVVGADRYTDKQIKNSVLQTRPDYNSIYLYLKYKFFTTAQIPFVEKIDVELVNNHKVTINVYEKIVAGCVEFMGEYLYFDKDGIIVESSPKKIEDVPIINGLQFSKIILHEKLNVQKNELFDVIINLTKLINKYELIVNTINFDSNYEVTLVCGDINVLLGKKNTYDEPLSDLKNILEKAEGTGVYELDMRDYEKGSGYVPGKIKK
ncbi:MAG: cell division protein FtsQ/DivIB [Herbinix sp.]|nr:cell division protein FtsQ/DivIB [Herbinix sp.]